MLQPRDAGSGGRPSEGLEAEAEPRPVRMSGQPPCPVVIVGAGLTGMSTAYHLRRGGIGCRVLERAREPGGLCVTREERGYRFDRTGHLLHCPDPELRALALSWLETVPEPSALVREVARKAVIWSHEHYTRYPFQANLHGLPPAVAHQCLRDFVRAWLERERAGGKVPLTGNFEQFCLAAFGRGISEHFMLPYNERLWGVAPREITAEWCERYVPVPALDDVLAGAVGLEDRELGYNARFHYPAGGIGRLSEGLAQAAGPIELEREVTGIDAERRTVELAHERVPYDVLVSTAPLPELVARIHHVPLEVREAARALRCTPLWYLDVALRRPCGVPYHWCYVPERRYPFYRVGCYSAFSVEMAPAGTSNLYVELVDRAEPVLATLLPEVAAALVSMRIIDTAEAILFARARRIDHAYVIFDQATPRALELVQSFLRSSRVLSVGRYGGWTYSAMADAIVAGREAAAQVERWLALGTEPR